MTILAYKNGTLAINTGVEIGQAVLELSTDVLPIIRTDTSVGPVLIGGIGPLGLVQAAITSMVDWDGHLETYLPLDQFNDDSRQFLMLLVNERGVFEYTPGLPVAFLGKLDQHAVGAQSDYLFGAMDAGASAHKAVDLACSRCMDVTGSAISFSL